MDPVLSQGCTLAIEDAVGCAEALRPILHKGVTDAELLARLSEYNRGRLVRVNTVRKLSATCTKYGTIVYPGLLTIRDHFIQLAPESLKSAVFDWFMRRSLGLTKW